MTLYDTLTKIERRIKNETITKVVKVSDGYVVFTCGYDGYTPLHEPYFFDRTLSVSGYNMFDKANKEKLSAGKTVYKDSTPYRKGHKYGIRMDADNDGRERGGEETSDNGSGGGNTALPYGLCKKYGIELPKGTTPTQAWEALKDKTGISADKAYNELEKSGTAQSITPEASSGKSENTPQSAESKPKEEYKAVDPEKAKAESWLQTTEAELKDSQSMLSQDMEALTQGKITFDEIDKKRSDVYQRFREARDFTGFPPELKEKWQGLVDEYRRVWYRYEDLNDYAQASENAIEECTKISKSSKTAQEKADKMEISIAKLNKLKKTFDESDTFIIGLFEKAENSCREIWKPVYKQMLANQKAVKAAQDDIASLEYTWLNVVAKSPTVGKDVTSSKEDFSDVSIGQVAVDTHNDNTLYMKSSEEDWICVQTGEIISAEELYYKGAKLLSEKLKVDIIDDAENYLNETIDELSSNNVYNTYKGSYAVEKGTALDIESLHTDFIDKLEKIKHKKVVPKKQPVKSNPTGKILTETHGCKHSSDAYTKERKDGAMWCKSVSSSIAQYGAQAKRAYLASTYEQRQATYRYTQGSGYLNRPLSGFKRKLGTDSDGWSKGEFVGIGNVDFNHEDSNGYNHMVALTEFLGKNEFDTDIWVQHGFETKAGVLAFLGIGSLTEENVQSLIDNQTDCHFPGFMSCGAAKGTGFNSDYIINIYAPKGTKGVYVAPGSYYGGSSAFNGEQQVKAGHENEILLQRDIHARVTKYERKGIQWYVDVEIISQEPVDYSKS